MEIDPFAEIEIESEEPAVKGQKITGLDPIREKFYDMRGLAPNDPSSWHNAKLFYRQGKLMEDFTDDCDHYEPLRMYSPCYQRLGYDQLRTYFTWRAKVRQGNLIEASPSYVFLHMYELLSGIGSRGPVDGLNKLLALWKAYGESSTIFDSYFPGWLKDYHIYYKLPHTFAEFIEMHGLRSYFTDLTMFDLNSETTLADWLSVGTYDISKSTFYKSSADNLALFRIAFHKAIEAMEKKCLDLGKNLQDMFYYRSSTASWLPFDSAVFYPWLKQNDREVRLSSYHVYACSNNKWTTRKATPYKHKDELVGYFVKDLELQLRNILDFKGKLAINTAKLNVAEALIEGMGTSMQELSQLFYNTAKAVHYDLTRIVVTVDKQNVERIREEAEVIQDKLIVEESAPLKESVPAVLDTPDISQDDVHDVMYPSVIAVPPVVPTQPPVISDSPQNPLSETETSPWATLKNTLSATELEALKISLENPENIKSFADENGIMLEILADGINEKAMDIMGDNILELSDTMVIYEDYLSEIEDFLGILREKY